jgi:hypothetical protein
VTVFRGDIPVASSTIADGATQTLKLAALLRPILG